MGLRDLFGTAREPTRTERAVAHAKQLEKRERERGKRRQVVRSDVDLPRNKSGYVSARAARSAAQKAAWAEGERWRAGRSAAQRGWYLDPDRSNF